jgi:hypothetical protein
VPTSCPASSLVTHSHLFGVPIKSYRHVRALRCATSLALATLDSRRVVAALLIASAGGPGAGVQLCSGASTASSIAVGDVLTLLKLVAASCDSFGDGKVSTGAGLLAAQGGGKIMSPGAPIMGALQVRDCRRGPPPPVGVVSAAQGVCVVGGATCV